MKKSVAVLIAFILLMTMLVPVSFAVESEIRGTAVCTENSSDIYFSISFQAQSAESYEEFRKNAYSELRKNYTDAQIALMPDYSVMRYETKALCRITLNGESYDLKTVPIAQRSMELTLFEDILPCLVKNGAYTDLIQNGFDFTLSLYAVADMDGSYAYPFSDSGELGTFTAPATAYIEYDLPFEADNKNNPVFLFYPYPNDIILENPTRQGYTFKGWVNEWGIAIDRIPQGTRRIKIGAGWGEKTFRMLYILRTRTEYNFERCQHSNPFVYSSATGLLLLAPQAPAGWVFAGWFENEELTGEPVTSIAPNREGDITLYAKWHTENEVFDEKIKTEKWGDLNDDGKITAADARLALRAAVGLEVLTHEYFRRVDFEGEGKISAANARLILRVSVGLDNMKDILKKYGRI